jgi:hypothetical protein
MDNNDEMREGESYDEYVARHQDSGLTEQELANKATDAWYARRAKMRRSRD